METIEETAAPTETGTCAAVVHESQSGHCPECGALLLPNGTPARTVELRCFVRRIKDGRYLAECIDLDLGAEADTFEGAKSSLRDAIVGYLMVVLEGVETDQELPAAILRPSPLSHRIRYHFAYWLFRAAEVLFSRRQSSTKRFYQGPYDFSSCGSHAGC